MKIIILDWYYLFVVNKNINTTNDAKEYYRIETSDFQKCLDDLSRIDGLRVLSSQSNSIIISYNSKVLPLIEDGPLSDSPFVRSIHRESDLIEYYYD